MVRMMFFNFLLLAMVQVSSRSQEPNDAYHSDALRIKAISAHSFVHISYLNTAEYGKVACNGLIYLANNEALVFDTPTDQKASKELLFWLTHTKKVAIKAVVINHFHVDCLGGLETFHKAGIPSYANHTTIKLASNSDVIAPIIGFDLENKLEVGGKFVHNRFFGEAHTKDNIISYIPDEGLLFGGCMIKSLKAQKGNLTDANLQEWSNTIRKIKMHYPNLKTIVPGHGEHGNTELLDYTIALFKSK